MFFFFQAEDGIRDIGVTGVQTCALPISRRLPQPGEHVASELVGPEPESARRPLVAARDVLRRRGVRRQQRPEDERHREEQRSEEHTSELQSRQYLVCRLLLEKKKKS